MHVFRHVPSVRSLGAAKCALVLLAGAPFLHASEWDKKTTVTFHRRVEIPGHVLEPGTYVMKLLNSSSNRNIVQFMNERENHTYALVLAIPAYRLEPTGRTKLTYYEAPEGQPEPLRTWFYPGDRNGQEFAYSKQRRTELARLNTDISTASTTTTASPTTTLSALAPLGPPVQTKSVPNPAQIINRPVIPETPFEPGAAGSKVTAAPGPAPQDQAIASSSAGGPSTGGDAVPEELPKTGSHAPLQSLLGLSSIGIACVVRRVRRSAKTL